MIVKTLVLQMSDVRAPLFTAETKRQRGEQRTNCPVCNRSISGTDEELSQHVNRCLNGVSNFTLSQIWEPLMYLDLLFSHLMPSFGTFCENKVTDLHFNRSNQSKVMQEMSKLMLFEKEMFFGTVVLAGVWWYRGNSWCWGRGGRLWGVHLGWTDPCQSHQYAARGSLRWSKIVHHYTLPICTNHMYQMTKHSKLH